MRSTKMCRILVVVLGLMVCQVGTMKAEPIGPAFTYQGRLMDGDGAANGLFDLVFVLFDAPEGSNEIGVTGAENVEVIDGYFTMPLNFETGLFNGEKRWLEVYVRPGDVNDPDAFVPLWPRQEITPAPYALYSANSGSGTAGYIAKFADGGRTENSVIFQSESNIGIGTINPQAKLSLGLDIGLKKLALWDGVNDFYGFGVDWGRMVFSTNNTEKMTIRDNGNVGIGTLLPDTLLEVEGPTNGAALIKTDQKGNRNYTGLRIDRANVEKWFVGMSHIDDKLIFRRTAISNDMVIDTAGNVGIGTFSPDVKLTVAGTIKGTTSAVDGKAIYGDATGSGGIGVFGKTSSGVGVGVLAEAVSGGDALRAIVSGGYGTAIYGEGGPAGGYAAEFKGNVMIRSRTTGLTVIELGEGLDYAEGFDVSNNNEIAPGTVLIIDAENPGKLA
ncbi:MAG: hypothetical protein OEW48_15995, partial [Phycisphaerae bacterium]|nr:hypothetical protein [Phycisphaerae bacterium]